jgi:hypothetical protein
MTPGLGSTGNQSQDEGEESGPCIKRATARLEYLTQGVNYPCLGGSGR